MLEDTQGSYVENLEVKRYYFWLSKRHCRGRTFQVSGKSAGQVIQLLYRNIIIPGEDSALSFSNRAASTMAKKFSVEIYCHGPPRLKEMRLRGQGEVQAA